MVKEMLGWKGSADEYENRSDVILMALRVMTLKCVVRI